MIIIVTIIVTIILLIISVMIMLSNIMSQAKFANQSGMCKSTLTASFSSKTMS